jgi:hypothetical protein
MRDATSVKCAPTSTSSPNSAFPLLLPLRHSIRWRRIWAQQIDQVPVLHGAPLARRNGRWCWPVPEPGDVLITAAYDHTDHALEVHGVACSKNASPDVLGRQAWRLVDVADHLDQIRIVGRVGAERTVILDATFESLAAASVLARSAALPGRFTRPLPC